MRFTYRPIRKKVTRGTVFDRVFFPPILWLAGKLAIGSLLLATCNNRDADVVGNESSPSIEIRLAKDVAEGLTADAFLEALNGMSMDREVVYRLWIDEKPACKGRLRARETRDYGAADPFVLVLFGKEIRVNGKPVTEYAGKDHLFEYADAIRLTNGLGAVFLSLEGNMPLSSFVTWQNAISQEGHLPIVYLGKLTPTAAEILQF